MIRRLKIKQGKQQLVVGERATIHLHRIDDDILELDIKEYGDPVLPRTFEIKPIDKNRESVLQFTWRKAQLGLYSSAVKIKQRDWHKVPLELENGMAVVQLPKRTQVNPNVALRLERGVPHLVVRSDGRGRSVPYLVLACAIVDPIAPVLIMKAKEYVADDRLIEFDVSYAQWVLYVDPKLLLSIK